MTPEEEIELDVAITRVSRKLLRRHFGIPDGPVPQPIDDRPINVQSRTEGVMYQPSRPTVKRESPKVKVLVDVVTNDDDVTLFVASARDEIGDLTRTKVTGRDKDKVVDACKKRAEREMECECAFEVVEMNGGA